MPQEQTPSTDPEQLRNQAVQAHVAGNLTIAAELRSLALGYMEEADPHFPGVQATLAFAKRKAPATFVAFNELRQVAKQAVETTKSRLSARGPVGYDHRILAEDLPATLLHYGVLIGGIAARTEIRQEPPGPGASFADYEKMIGTAHRLSKNIPRTWGFIHQTQINLARRRAAMLGLTGKPLRGMAAAVGAVLKAPLSESPHFVANSSELSHKERAGAKAKAALGGIAAGAVCAANLPGVRNIVGREAPLKLFAKMEGMSWLLTAPYEVAPVLKEGGAEMKAETPPATPLQDPDANL